MCRLAKGEQASQNLQQDAVLTVQKLSKLHQVVSEMREAKLEEVPVAAVATISPVSPAVIEPSPVLEAAPAEQAPILRSPQLVQLSAPVDMSETQEAGSISRTLSMDNPLQPEDVLPDSFLDPLSPRLNLANQNAKASEIDNELTAIKEELEAKAEMHHIERITAKIQLLRDERDELVTADQFVTTKVQMRSLVESQHEIKDSMEQLMEQFRVLEENNIVRSLSRSCCFTNNKFLCFCSYTAASHIVCHLAVSRTVVSHAVLALLPLTLLFLGDI